MDPLLILKPIIPYVGSIKFAPNKMIKLQATFPPTSNEFAINLQCGPNTHPPDDIALHIWVQLLNRQICLNSLQNGIWGEEVRFSNVPIEADKQFEMIVLCEFNQYKVIINDEHSSILPQRIWPEMVSHLRIDGDISIDTISYESIVQSNGSSPLPSTINQFINANLEKPPSYENAVNGVQVPIVQLQQIAAIPRHRPTPRKSVIALIWIFVIAGFAVFGLMAYFRTKYLSNHVEVNSYTLQVSRVDE